MMLELVLVQHDGALKDTDNDNAVSSDFMFDLRQDDDNDDDDETAVTCS